MERLERDAPLPAQMQGRWTDLEDPTSELIVDGGEIICFGEAVSYDYKLVDMQDGALTVSLNSPRSTLRCPLSIASRF